MYVHDIGTQRMYTVHGRMFEDVADNVGRCLCQKSRCLLSARHLFRQTRRLLAQTFAQVALTAG
jgi:hypothetical protein